jgi:hypothetical protein
VAAITGCLSALAPAGAGVAPGAPAAALPSAAGAAAPPAVIVRVAPDGGTSPGYRIEVRNISNSTVNTTVRQEVPRGAPPIAITGGGQATTPAGQDRGTEISWQLQLPAQGGRTLRTTLAQPPDDRPVAAPACAFVTGGDTPYDCATATWDGALMHRTAPGHTPWWLRPAVLGAGLAALLLLAAVAWTSRRLWQRRRVLRRAASRQRAGVATYDPHAMRGTLYPRPSAPGRLLPRRKPPVWLVVGVALAILGTATAAVVWTATGRVEAIRADRQPSSGAWIGRSTAGPIGASLRDSALEFTVYRLACPPAQPQAAQQCQATVGVHNGTPENQSWYGPMQRAYLPGGTWVTTDETATRAANGGRDPFAVPVPGGGQLLLPLVFTMSRPEPPTHLELRSAVFSAGVRVNVA